MHTHDALSASASSTSHCMGRRWKSNFQVSFPLVLILAPFKMTVPRLRPLKNRTFHTPVCIILFDRFSSTRWLLHLCPGGDNDRAFSNLKGHYLRSPMSNLSQYAQCDARWRGQGIGMRQCANEYGSAVFCGDMSNDLNSFKGTAAPK